MQVLAFSVLDKIRVKSWTEIVSCNRLDRGKIEVEIHPHPAVNDNQYKDNVKQTFDRNLNHE